jgi:hypothetical protein
MRQLESERERERKKERLVCVFAVLIDTSNFRCTCFTFQQNVKINKEVQNHKEKLWLDVFRPPLLSSPCFRCKYIQSTAGSNHWTTNMNVMKLGIALRLSCKPDGHFYHYRWNDSHFCVCKQRYCWLWCHDTVYFSGCLGESGSAWRREGITSMHY